MADEPEEGLAVVISAREIYNEIVGMRDDVRSLSQTSHNTDQTLDDHENRLRAVERWKYGMPIAAIAAIASCVATIVQNK